jgi:hypothetical protein
MTDTNILFSWYEVRLQLLNDNKSVEVLFVLRHYQHLQYILSNGGMTAELEII